MIMATVYAIHGADLKRLETIKTEMATLGPPTLRVVDCGDFFMALEGSHRLAAAQDLGLMPLLIVHDQEEVLTLADFDWFENEVDWDGPTCLAGEIAGKLYTTQAVPYNFTF